MASTLDLILTVLFVIFVVINIFFNVLLVLAIHRKKSLQTPMNLLILHLAVADVLIGVFIIPRHILSYAIIYPESNASDFICYFLTGGNFIWTSVTASSGILTIIALERFFAVVYPHKANLRVTKKRLKWLVWACWLSSVAFNLPSLLVLKYDHKNEFCMENWPEWASPKTYVGFAFVAGNSSVVAMYILYSAILLNLWKKHKAVSEVSRTARINARKRVTKMLILMTVVHTICRTPNYTFYMLSYFNPGAKYGSTVYSFTVFLILLNSASHPFFFCWYMNNLRRQMFAVLPSCFLDCIPSRLRQFGLPPTDVETESATQKGAHRMKDAHSSDYASNSYEDKKKKFNSKRRTYSMESKDKCPQVLTNEYHDKAGISRKMDKHKEAVQTVGDLILTNNDVTESKMGKAEHDNNTLSAVMIGDANSDKTTEVYEVEENKFALESESDSNAEMQGKINNQEKIAAEIENIELSGVDVIEV